MYSPQHYSPACYHCHQFRQDLHPNILIEGPGTRDQWSRYSSTWPGTPLRILTPCFTRITSCLGPRRYQVSRGLTLYSYGILLGSQVFQVHAHPPSIRSRQPANQSTDILQWHNSLQSPGKTLLRNPPSSPLPGLLLNPVLSSVDGYFDIACSREDEEGVNIHDVTIHLDHLDGMVFTSECTNESES